MLEQETLEAKNVTQSLPVRPWIQPADQPILWIVQPPRSGGTLLLRLFDSHSQLHVFPTVFAFSNADRIMPPNDTYDLNIAQKHVVQPMSLAKFDRIGIRKKASNSTQWTYPFYFDQHWYDSIFGEWLNSHSLRDILAAHFTATFNAWRNYQSLYGNKRFVLGHMTLWKPHLFAINYRNFRQNYPDGYMLYVVRPVLDWLASFINLKVSSHFNGNVTDALNEFESYVDAALSLHQEKKLILVSYKRLVENTEDVMKTLAARLGLEWEDILIRPTFNRQPFLPNSSSFDAFKPGEVARGRVGIGNLLPTHIQNMVPPNLHEKLELLLAQCES